MMCKDSSGFFCQQQGIKREKFLLGKSPKEWDCEWKTSRCRLSCFSLQNFAYNMTATPKKTWKSHFLLHRKIIAPILLKWKTKAWGEEDAHVFAHVFPVWHKNLLYFLYDFFPTMIILIKESIYWRQKQLCTSY